jgi:hypothetical protein
MPTPCQSHVRSRWSGFSAGPPGGTSGSYSFLTTRYSWGEGGGGGDLNPRPQAITALLPESRKPKAAVRVRGARWHRHRPVGARSSGAWAWGLELGGHWGGGGGGGKAQGGGPPPPPAGLRGGGGGGGGPN